MSFYCIKCKKSITSTEYNFSNDNFKKSLCRAHQPTMEVRKLGKFLKEIGDWTVEYEKFDGHKSVDISIPSAKVIIEVDGLQHTTTKDQALADLKRNYYSYKKSGFITLHVPNILVSDDSNINEVAKFISDFLEENYNDVRDNFIVSFFSGLFGKKYKN